MLPYLFLRALSPQTLKQVSQLPDFLCLELCDYIMLLCKFPYITCKIIIWIALNTLAQAFIYAWCFLPRLIPKLNIDMRNWSQDT